MYLQLFREKLSEKVHATIQKGIAGGFKFTVLERNLKELVRKAVEMCLRVLKESIRSRFDLYSRQNQCIDHCLVPRRLSLKRARKERREGVPSHGPLQFNTSHSRFALASAMRKTKRLRRRLVLIISHITFRDCRLHIFPTTFLEIAVS